MKYNRPSRSPTVHLHIKGARTLMLGREVFSDSMRPTPTECPPCRSSGIRKLNMRPRAYGVPVHGVF